MFEIVLFYVDGDVTGPIVPSLDWFIVIVMTDGTKKHSHNGSCENVDDWLVKRGQFSLSKNH